MSRQNFEQSIKSFNKNLDEHINAYIREIEETLEAKVHDIKTDYIDGEDCSEKTLELFNAFQNTLITGKYSLKDSINEFYDFPDCSFSSCYDLSGELENIIEENEDSIKGDETDDAESLHEKLKSMGERLHLTDCDDTQKEILRLLNDEYGIEFKNLYL